MFAAMADKRWDQFATGRWTGTYAVLDMDVADVARMLRADLRLGPQSMTGAGKHPVYFMFGRQSDVASGLPLMSCIGMTYLEAMIVIPFVRYDGGTRDFNYMPRLYLDQYYPSWLGRTAFGFDKVWKDVECGPTSYAVHRSWGSKQLLWDARFASVTKYDAREVEVGYQELSKIFAMPFLGFRESMLKTCPLASWMTFSKSVVIPVELDLAVKDKMLSVTNKFGGLNSKVVGTAAHLVLDWTLSYPAIWFDT
jgi:hypothetical protein